MVNIYTITTSGRYFYREDVAGHVKSLLSHESSVGTETSTEGAPHSVNSRITYRAWLAFDRLIDRSVARRNRERLGVLRKREE